jgi:hypothetical protein
MFVDIAGRVYSPGNKSSSIDSSQFLTIPKANPIYVNQTGDDMSGDLDMKGNKIKNVKDPTDVSHVVNKRFLDNEHRNMMVVLDKLIDEKVVEANNNLEKTLDNKKITAAMNMNNNKIINLANPTEPTDSANKYYVDYLESRLRQLMNSKTYGFILQIGSNMHSHFKTTVYDIKIDQNTDLFLDEKTVARFDPPNFNLQVTPILDNLEFHDEIACNIQKYDVILGGLRVYILSYRATKEGWGLSIKAHLLVTVFYNDMPIQNSNT